MKNKSCTMFIIFIVILISLCFSTQLPSASVFNSTQLPSASVFKPAEWSSERTYSTNWVERDESGAWTFKAIDSLSDRTVIRSPFVVSTIDIDPLHFPRGIPVEFEEGCNFFAAWDYEEAIECFDGVIKKYPEEYPIVLNAYNEKGVALFMLHRFNEALSTFDRAIELNPNKSHSNVQYSLSWNNKGAALICLGRYNEAVLAFDKANSTGIQDILLETYLRAAVYQGEQKEPITSTATPTPTVTSTPKTTPTTTPTSEEGTPGFGAIFTIAGLLAVAYLMRRWK